MREKLFYIFRAIIKILYFILLLLASCYCLWGIVNIVFGSETALNEAPVSSEQSSEVNQESYSGSVPEFVRNNKLAERIVFCESSNNPKVCNDKVHCEKGMGLFGIISNTWNSTLVKMARANEFMPEECWQLIYLSEIELLEKFRDEAIFDPVCNSMVGLWLLEHEGTKHWGYEGAEWGSYECWKNYVN